VSYVLEFKMEEMDGVMSVIKGSFRRFFPTAITCNVDQTLKFSSCEN